MAFLHKRGIKWNSCFWRLFLTSSGFLVGAAVAPAPPAETVPAPVAGSGDAGTVRPSLARQPATDVATGAPDATSVSSQLTIYTKGY